MYGIVNKSMEELVVSKFGEDTWNKVVKRSGVSVDYFISNEPYDDAVTYQLAGAISEELQVSLNEVLFLFGEWWILKTTVEKYKGLIRTGGQTLRNFLINLPEFHNKIMSYYPKLSPPEFKVSDIGENSIHIHYYSHREGLSEFVKGILTGLGTLYETPVIVERQTNSNSLEAREVFKVSW